MFGFSDFNDSHEFKPILSEINDSPVSPLGRSTFWIVVAVTIFVVLWATFGQVDIVVTGRGRVIPEGQIKTLQPLDTGIVTKILVKEGDTVKVGQVLMEIDPATTEPTLLSSRQTLAYNKIEEQRILATLQDRPFAPNPNDTDAATVATQQTLYQAALDSYHSQLDSKMMEKKQVLDQISSLQESQRQNKDLLAIAEANYKRYLPVREIVARQDFDRAEKDYLTLSHQKQDSVYKLAELQHRLDNADSEIQTVQQNFRTSQLNDLTQREKSQIDNQAKLSDVQFRQKKQRLVSTVNGTVDQIFIHTLGGVVTPAERLMTIVPSNAPLRIEAMYTNQDIGYIRPGQMVTLKVDTFDFQKYGTLDGRVEKVSSDSHVSAPPEGNAPQTPAGNQDDAQKAQAVYTVTILPPSGSAKKTLLVEHRPEGLRPGLTLTTEIKVGKRRIIEFFLNPLIKSVDESFKLR